jgi:hypothetical protein
MLGWSFAMQPVSSNKARTLKATTAFLAAAALGWPFTILLAVPYVLEELLLAGRQVGFSIPKRMSRLIESSFPGLSVLVCRASYA